MTYRRCQDCGFFYDKKEPACTDCGAPPYGFSKALATGKLNGHLNGMLASAERERKLERSLRSR